MIAINFFSTFTRRTSSNALTLQKREISVKMRVATHCKRFLKEAVKSPSLEVLV